MYHKFVFFFPHILYIFVLILLYTYVEVLGQIDSRIARQRQVETRRRVGATETETETGGDRGRDRWRRDD
jgi:hypothetical protein